MLLIAVLQRLEGFPQDLADLTFPTGTDVGELSASLDSLAAANPTPEARNSIVQATAIVPPSKLLEGVQLAWINDEGAGAPIVSAHLARALCDGVYDPRKWLTEAAQSNTVRGRDVLTTWGLEQFDVSQVAWTL